MTKSKMPQRGQHQKTADFVAKLEKYLETLFGDDKALLQKVIGEIKSGNLVVNPFQTPEEFFEKAKRHAK